MSRSSLFFKHSSIKESLKENQKDTQSFIRKQTVAFCSKLLKIDLYLVLTDLISDQFRPYW